PIASAKIEEPLTFERIVGSKRSNVLDHCSCCWRTIGAAYTSGCKAIDQGASAVFVFRHRMKGDSLRCPYRESTGASRIDCQDHLVQDHLGCENKITQEIGRS